MNTTPIVLVPGFCLGAWAWDEVAAALRAGGHDVTAVTLPGPESADADRSSDAAQRRAGRRALRARWQAALGFFVEVRRRRPVPALARLDRRWFMLAVPTMALALG